MSAQSSHPRTDVQRETGSALYWLWSEAFKHLRPRFGSAHTGVLPSDSLPRRYRENPDCISDEYRQAAASRLNEETVMSKHENGITNARTYTALTSAHSREDSAALCGADLERYGNASRDESAVARWENEGGATKKSIPAAMPKLVARKFALAGRAAYDSLQRSQVEGMMDASNVNAVAVDLTPHRGPAIKSEERGGLGIWRSAPAHPRGRQRGRRTMGRHGNRP
jgi:hypothetical protein